MPKWKDIQTSEINELCETHSQEADLLKLYECSGFWVVVGVVVGFLLSVIWEIIKDKLSIRKKEKPSIANYVVIGD
ncbi:MAG: hypothetical protein QMD71_01695 [bacterium]|nr:hypothetical protein [bacterium]